MARILILSDVYPRDLSSGRHLRVKHLCEELARDHDCFFVEPSGAEPCEKPDPYSLFEDIRVLPARPSRRQGVIRHLRFGNARYLERHAPRFFGETVAEVAALAEYWRVDSIINVAPSMAEIPIAVDLPRILDWPDCSSLTGERLLSNRHRKMSALERWNYRLNFYRQRDRERRLLRDYTFTTTIAEPDRKKMLAVSGVPSDRVVVVPNGVAQDALATRKPQLSRSRSVVFWGNLDFPPNWTAVSFFYKNVFLPYLADEGVELFVAGRGENPALREMQGHPLVHLAGFKEDIFDYVANHGLMINPMVEGSGLKNKVLESFAIGLPVVSTSLGIEAIEGEPGKHFIVADEPALFARSILDLLDDAKRADTMAREARKLVESRYSWRSAGQRLSQLVGRLPVQGG